MRDWLPPSVVLDDTGYGGRDIPWLDVSQDCMGHDLNVSSIREQDGSGSDRRPVDEVCDLCDWDLLSDLLGLLHEPRGCVAGSPHHSGWGDRYLRRGPVPKQPI